MGVIVDIPDDMLSGNVFFHCAKVVCVVTHSKREYGVKIPEKDDKTLESAEEVSEGPSDSSSASRF